MSSSPVPQPSSPAEWKAYGLSKDVASIPLREAENVNENAKIAMLRGVYLEASAALLPSMLRLNVFTDVLALTGRQTVISPHKNGVIQVTARVVTADAPATLAIPSDASGAISIYAAILDQPVTVTTGSESLELDLGPESEYAGVSIAFDNGKMDHEYEKKYPRSTSDDLKASLNTQLRISLVQFWKNTSIAVSLCSYVAAMTTDQGSFSLLNTQAVAIGQQLAGQVAAGPDMSYAPALVLDRYKESTQQALNAATAFETQFERFQDKKESVEIHKQAWDTMLAQARNENAMRVNLRNLALEKYKSTRETAVSCQTQFEDNNFALEILRIRFENGLQKWKDEQELKAVFQILMAATSFALNIATLCMGNPGGGPGAADAVGQAVKAVKVAEGLVGQIGKFLKSDTFEKLAEVVETLLELYPLVQSVVDAVGQFEADPSVEIPSLDTITGSSRGDANAAAIVTMAAWDKWVLESDDQMEFAVSEGVDSASEYRLALRKHAINGKQLAQAQAESVKAGYEYVQAQMEVIVSQQQIDGLQKLRDGYEEQEAVYALAESMLYDRAMALRTTVVLSLRNMAWAYRYWALAESSISLDSRKSLVEYQQDLSIVIQEMVNADSRYSSDFQPFDYNIDSADLPVDQGQSMKEGIMGSSRTGSFTLVPQRGLASDFDEGSHYRLDGLNPTLLGVLPNPGAVKGGVAVVNLQITTSGIYADIQKEQVFRFASLPQVRRCSYEIDENGVRGKTRVYPAFETKDHAEPTPFTQ
ncbi:uncharacterized protein MAM_04484 [Metarhizium album ARSEF 1941]|uniref:Uncharacterized protein n=1 Tax=Metarhizium album (strain ARSEF 1941) TaxID=1081103 RepID=A0A0B2WUZ4_METAS|nr:uncharacterized protein MAM_04484 [Metarhizium album ARSEF 1941]KHN97469.1 hypothetical protein MAM_04484 [Metarhizium album ARSEF 1941]